MEQTARTTGKRKLWLGLALVAAVAVATVVGLFLSAGDNAAKQTATPPSTLSDGAATEANAFEGKGYSFRYPASWVEGPKGKTSVGGFRAEFESSGGEELVLSFIAEREPEALLETDYPQVMQFKSRWLTANNMHVLEEPAWGTTGNGVRALRYVFALEGAVAQRDTLIFNGRMFYEFSCRFRSEETKRDCDLVERSFRLT
jgi:hypothetical protein